MANSKAKQQADELLDAKAKLPNALTLRQRLLIYAALNYCQCNVGDLNAAFGEEMEVEEGKINIDGSLHDEFNEEEFMSLLSLFSMTK
jgi:hypothetical protein